MTPLELAIEDLELGVGNNDKSERYRRRLAAKGIVLLQVRVPKWAEEEVKAVAALRLGQHLEHGGIPPELELIEGTLSPVPALGPPSGNTGGIPPHPEPVISLPSQGVDPDAG
jgi:hypothetical protein